MHLVIGSRNWSSWSLRSWLGLRIAGLAFEEILIPLRQPDTRERILRYSPSGKVPLLIDGDLRIWDSLAIAEYVAEVCPSMWPEAPADRALARSVCAEMHSGFSALRAECPMDLGLRCVIQPSEALQADLQRLWQLLGDLRHTYAAHGPFLFGSISWADAYYAPVALRFISYGIVPPPAIQAWMDSLLALPPLQEWLRAAALERQAG